MTEKSLLSSPAAQEIEKALPDAPERPHPAFPLQTLLALFAVYLIWGSTYLAVRIAVKDFPPLMTAGLRFFLAGTVLFAYLRLRGTPLPTPREWKASALVGTLLVVGNAGVAVAVHWVSSGLAALALAATPLWMALFGGAFGQWPNRREWIGLGVGFLGIILLNSGSELRAAPLAVVALLISVLSWSWGSVWGRRLPLPPGMMASAAEMLTGGAIMLLASVAYGERLRHVPSLGAVLALLYLIFFGSVLAFSAYDYLLQRARPALASSYAYVNPGVAVVLGVLLAGEKITLWGIVALGVILCGVLLITRNKGK